jgi:thioester reductase-like protein
VIVLLTGATGVVGSAVAEQLLADRDVQLRLIVRGADAPELDERLGRLLAYWQTSGEAWSADHEALRRRVEVFRGDTSQAAFGLPASDFERLVGECTHVIHCASAVRMNLPLEEARRSAAAGTRHAIAFAQALADAGRLAKLELVSTVGVGGRRPGALPEQWLVAKRAYHNTYEKAKAEAEILAMEASAHGLPLTVHRPSMVIGAARSGRVIHFQIFYHLAEFLSGRRTLGLVPDPGPTRLDVVPSDYVGAAIAWSARTNATAGQVLHLCAGPDDAIPIDALRTRVRDRFRAAGLMLPPRVTVPRAWFRASLPVLARLASPKQRRALATLPTFLDYLAEDQRFANAQTRALLSAAGIATPDFAAAVDRSLDHYLARRARR